MKELNVFDLDNDKKFSRKALRKILRPDEDNLEQRDVWQLIETFGFPKPLYRYADNEVYDDNENTYSKAVENFFSKFHPECAEKSDNKQFILDGGYESVADYIINEADNGIGYNEYFDDSELDESGEPTEEQIDELKEYLNDNYNYLP